MMRGNASTVPDRAPTIVAGVAILLDGEVLFARWILKPRLVRIRDALNNFLLPMYGKSAEGLEFDFVKTLDEKLFGEDFEAA